jgi:hypothetical protein
MEKRESSRKTAPGAATLAGTLLFLVTGMWLVLSVVPAGWGLPTWLSTAADHWFLGWLLLPALGVVVGYCLNFPRWSYPYVGLQLIMSLYMTNVSTPGLRILGYTFPRHFLWGWLAWIPLFVAIGAGLLITRSLRPLGRFFTNLGGDATQLSFAFFGFFPLLILIAFDEVTDFFSLPWIALLSALMVLIAWLYMRQVDIPQRTAVLAGGLALLLAGTIVGTYMYWGKAGMALIPAITLSVIVGLVMLLPALIGFLYHLFEPGVQG